MMLAIAPTLVRMARAEAGRPEPIVDLIDELRADGVRAVSPNGVLGDPRRGIREPWQDAADPTDHRSRRRRRRVAIVTESFNRSFRLDGSYRRYDRIVIAGSPLRIFRLSVGGRAGRRGDRAAPAATRRPRQAHRSIRRSRRDPSACRRNRQFTADDVTIVVPAFNAQPSVASPNAVDVIVVDDGSEPPLAEVAGTTRRSGSRPIEVPARRATPASPRSRPRSSRSSTPTSISTTSGSTTLLPHFSDPRVALVAPRVASTEGSTTLAQYESATIAARPRAASRDGSPPARASATCRPRRCWSASTRCVRSTGSTRTLRTGEDVDMVWRLVDAGYRCRYEPASIVHHHPRRPRRRGLASGSRTAGRRHPSTASIQATSHRCG